MDIQRYRRAEQQWWLHCGTEPAEQWLDLKTPPTRVRLQVVGDGAPVLFLHGGPSAASVFAPLAARLQDFRCLLLDRPGCALSAPMDYSSDLLRDAMPDLIASCLDALGLAQVDIVGSSFGGACALWFAQRHPQRLRRIVLMGCPPFIPTMRPPLFLRLLATPGIGAVLARLPAGRGATRAFLKAMGQQRALRENDVPEAFFQWWIALGRDTQTMIRERELVRIGLTWRGLRPELMIGEPALQAIPHPTYLYWGVDEPMAAVAATRALIESMPQGRLGVIPGAGHLPWLDDPADAARRTREFLRGS
jgi:pimeloyl-ACP methyl ester carboxylesterase